MFSPACENGFWPIKYDNELYELFSEPDVVKTIKIGRLQKAGHFIRMLDNSRAKKNFLLKQVGCRRVGRLRLGWME
jgi:hypothetical protein